MLTPDKQSDWQQLSDDIKAQGKILGFQQIGITDTDLNNAEKYLSEWLDDQRHGQMEWMGRHGSKRTRPAELVENTYRIISARMDYLPDDTPDMLSLLNKPRHAYISRYALGRDYHKLMRKRLRQLAEWIRTRTRELDYRVFVDSAPVMEKPLAEKAGLGWIGKHTNLINERAGSWFFLGEIYTNLPLPVDQLATGHCGDCTACIDVCPTRAIIAPYELDARLCISYLTIELRGSIPVALRPLIGNRIYGCDDCQLFCPWNRFASFTKETDFHPRHQLDDIQLVELFQWDENEFLKKTEGSAIRRIGYESWLRNIAVALGNISNPGQDIIDALRTKLDHPSDVVREHVHWALEQFDMT
ncbi:MAG: tRNA epoxyqueuosine(34) reductase QueG [Gammaproteobacteria bacterium]|nr:MAG: tRNA epoxyqueuosine(34) reductase QueG [Gammaproteobacteria bacterium]